MRIGVLLALVLLAVPTASGAKIDPASVLGKPVKDFRLRDYRGKIHALKDYQKSKIVVIAVMGNECPLAKLYAPRLERLSRKFKDRGVVFLGLNANLQDSVREIAAYARIHKITFPILKDVGNKIADRLAAERTPEVIVLDQQRKVRYRGRIDDQYDVGTVLPKARNTDLINALEAVLAGKDVKRKITKSRGCIIGRTRRVKPTGTITYSKQISRLLQKRCVNCHRKGEIAPFPLTSYKEVLGWAEMMEEVIDEGRMPPWNANPKYGHFKNDSRMSTEEKELFYKWVENGCPKGDPNDLPKPVKYTVGWSIRQPDVVFKMRNQPYRVPAEGVVRYKYFSVQTHFKEDKWIQAAEARPGNRSVVHHIVVLVRPPGSRSSGLRRGFLAGYAPGLPPRVYPKGTARLIPKGSRLIFQLHYTPNGSSQLDNSSVGFVFADPKTVTHKASGGMIAKRRFEIPPGDGNYKVTSSHHFRSRQTLLSLTPHMHLRGKSFRYEAFYPNGKSEILLDVPKYDFNWQLRYDLATPKVMPRGTKIVCTARFDNSSENLNNPDPKKAVRWGDQTWEEMMIGWFSAKVKRK